MLLSSMLDGHSPLTRSGYCNERCLPIVNFVYRGIRSKDAAGASADPFHRMRHVEWLRENLWVRVVVTLVPLLATALAVAFAADGIALYCLAFVSGMYAMLAWAAWAIKPAQQVPDARIGEEDEILTARELDKLGRAGWRPVHDRKLGKSNVDHIIVGPGGVFAIETKNLKGPISVKKGKIKQGSVEHGSANNKCIDGALAIHDVIKLETERHMWVEGVVVFWGDFQQRICQEKNVTYLAGEELVAWLHERPAKFSGTEIDEVVTAIAGMPAARSLPLAS